MGRVVAVSRRVKECVLENSSIRSSMLLELCQVAVCRGQLQAKHRVRHRTKNLQSVIFEFKFKFKFSTRCRDGQNVVQVKMESQSRARPCTSTDFASCCSAGIFRNGSNIHACTKLMHARVVRVPGCVNAKLNGRALRLWSLRECTKQVCRMVGLRGALLALDEASRNMQGLGLRGAVRGATALGTHLPADCSNVEQETGKLPWHRRRP